MKLTNIHTPENPTPINIVFVHGMNSSASMWTSDICNIPKYILEQHDDVSIYVAEYEAFKFDLNNSFTIENYAINLISSLETEISHGSIKFICHSAGGLIVKKFTELLIEANEYADSELRNVLFSYSFIGVPHLGSKIFESTIIKYLSKYRFLERVFLKETNFLFQLKFLSPENVRLNDWFLNFINSKNLFVENFYETRRTRVFGVLYIRVVPVESGELKDKNNKIRNNPMNADHHTIVNAKTPDDLIISRINYLITKIKLGQSVWIDPTTTT